MKASLARLMTSRRFAPFFFTQFLGAFNDNVFRQGLILVIASTTVAGVSTNTLNNVALALFILPFFLFSAFAGQIADKYEKSMLVRRIKLAEVIIMLAGAVGLLLDAVYFLLAVLFCMGLQSTFFGPIKYSIIPQHLDDRELVAGNALVETGTFLAILLGSVAGVILEMEGAGDGLAPVAVVLMAILGYLAARRIPPARPAEPGLGLDWNLFRETARIIRRAREVRPVWISVLGISWFWFLGAAYTTQLKVYVDNYLHGTDSLYALLLATFSVGIGAGSLLCERLSGRRVELGLVPLGSIGLSVFGIDLFFSYQDVPAVEAMGIAAFLDQPAAWRVAFDLFAIGVFGGFYIVPLFAFIQHRSDPRHLSRIVAANNILNALLMVCSAVAAIVLVGALELSIPGFFLILAIANVVVATCLFIAVPEFPLRLVIWMLTHVIWRVKHEGLDNIPDRGPCVLVCEHVTPLDALPLSGVIRRPVRFVMPGPICRTPVPNRIFRSGMVIPVDSGARSGSVCEEALVRVRRELDDGQVVCILVEDSLTDIRLEELCDGIEKLVATTPAPVIPMALQGRRGSFLSPAGGRARARAPGRFRSRVKLVVGAPVGPGQVTAAVLREKVLALRGPEP